MTATAREIAGVVIIDDHRMFAETLARLLDEEPSITVLGIATTGDEGVQLTIAMNPRVVLVDYQLPDRNGVAIAAQIKQQRPKTMVVMLTGSADDRVFLAAINAGCSGFLTKDRAAAEVVRAVRGAARGEAMIDSEMLARLLPQLNRTPRSMVGDLAGREREILDAMARGLPNKAIARDLGLSVNTVRDQVESVLMKLGVHSTLEAVSRAVREGIIEYPSLP
jgi:two-component system response regulator DevR